MSLTPMDITNKEFKRRSFGRAYDRQDVDEFLDQVIQEFEKNLRVIADLKQQLEHLEHQLEQYRALEDTLNRTLVAAQETADDIKSNARKEAELIIQEARLQAEKLVESGRTKAFKILEENADLQRAVETMRVQLRSLLQAQLEMIDRQFTVPTPFELVAAGSEKPPAQAAVPAPPKERSDWEDELDGGVTEGES